MHKKSSISLFIAATSALAISSSVNSGENDMGGLKEWNTEMDVDADFILDKDAQNQALYYVNYFMNNGITVTNVLPTEKDAGEMGFSDVNKILKDTKKTMFEDVVLQKLKGL